MITAQQPAAAQADEVTVILTVWKRDRLKEQLEALLSQHHKPHQIWVYHCREFIQPNFRLLNEYPTVQYQYNSHDYGFFGRFSLGLMAQTPYLYILDDDVIPSKDWISHCIQLLNENNAIISSAGRIIPEGDYLPEKTSGPHFVADSDAYSETNYNPRDEVVDFGCNSWFLRPEWLHHFWSIKPFTLETGEDIHFSAACKLKAGIQTIVPGQRGHAVCGNLMKDYGFDEYAACNTSNFLKSREKILRYLIDEKGWRPINWAVPA